MYGKEPPQLLYGDDSVATVLRMTVTSYSVMEDWVMGELRLRHTYSTPNNGGRPWLVQYVGCCRLSSLTNNADANWAVTAEIDLLTATRSPRAATLPMISVPMAGMGGGLPSIYIPTQEARGMEWGEGKPFYVGTVLAFSGGAFLRVPLAAASAALTAGQGCMAAATGPGCLFQLLRADAALRGRSVTVEGWVRTNSTAGSFAMAAADGAATTLFVHVGGSYVTVGHDWAGGTPVEAKFVLPADVTGQWVHVAVRRTTLSADCADAANRPGVQYHVWADGEAVWQEGLGVQETAEYCGPHASAEALLDAGELLFGARSAGGGEGVLEGSLDEWRVWSGAVAETDIRERMNVLLTPDKEAFLGDPTTATHPLVALWHMDPKVPCDADACPVAEVEPLYPKLPADRTSLTAVKAGPAVGMIVTADPDSSGVMGWESAVEEVLAGEGGEVLLNPRHGPGLYQVTLVLALSGGRAKVGLDFVVTVLDAAWDAGAMQWKLCGATGDACVHKGNEWVPSLMLSGFVRPTGECSAQMAPPTPSVAATHLAALTFPCSLTVFAGFDMHLSLAAQDPQEGMVGFNFGAVPAGMELAVEATGSAGAMSMAWQPCLGALGLHAVCLDAADRHGNGSVASASSPMACLQLNVTRDPPPMFDMAPGRTPATLPPLTMGEEVRVELFAADANCLDSVEIVPATPEEAPGSMLPPGAMLHAAQPAQPPAGMCVGSSRVMTWTPAYNHGGWSGRVCFAAVDSGGKCEGAAGQRTVQCVGVAVRRCVYALQAQQQLQEVAGMYGTDWMRLWSLNAALIHPDLIMWSGGPGRQELMVGHLYQAASEETVGKVAARMGMTLAQLRTLNVDVEGDGPLARGQHLCVMPNSCVGQASTHYSQLQYRDPAFFVKYKADDLPLPEPPVQPRQEP